MPLRRSRRCATWRHWRGRRNCRGWRRCFQAAIAEAEFLAAVFDLSDFMRDCIGGEPRSSTNLFDTNVAGQAGGDLLGCSALPFAEGVTERL